MNILFYTVFEVSPMKGGTERITATISKGLNKNFGIKCFSTYSIPINTELEKTQFEAKQRIAFGNEFEKELYNFVKKYNIDIIVNQGIGLTPLMRKVINQFQNKFLISVHHFNPGAEEDFINLHNILYNLKTSKSLKSLIKNSINLSLFPILKYKNHKRQIQEYKEAYKNSDKVVLLSDKFKPEWMAYANINDNKKFVCIHNALSFSTYFNIDNYKSKRHEVIIVSRFAERQKRISLALKIWNFIEKDARFNEWKLTIIGYGEEYINLYKNIVKRCGLERVTFDGAQNPVRYYNRAELLLFTSAYEGWGLTLTEAQQFGVVPLAFNSYASLTDIITDGENGFVIPEGNIKLYVDRLKTLMLDGRLRKQMAETAIESSKRFNIDNICQNWFDLFHQLITE